MFKEIRKYKEVRYSFWFDTIFAMLVVLWILFGFFRHGGPIIFDVIEIMIILFIWIIFASWCYNYNKRLDLEKIVKKNNRK